MGSTRHVIGTYCADRCGPTLIVTMALAILLAFAALFLFRGTGREAAPSPAAKPLPRNNTAR